MSPPWWRGSASSSPSLVRGRRQLRLRIGSKSPKETFWAGGRRRRSFLPPLRLLFGSNIDYRDLLRPAIMAAGEVDRPLFVGKVTP